MWGALASNPPSAPHRSPSAHPHTHTHTVPYTQSQHTPPCTLIDSYPPSLTHTRTHMHMHTHIHSDTLTQPHPLTLTQTASHTHTLTIPCSHTHPHTCSLTHNPHVLLGFYTLAHSPIHVLPLTYTRTCAHTRAHTHAQPSLVFVLPHPLPSLGAPPNLHRKSLDPLRCHHLEAPYGPQGVPPPHCRRWVRGRK